MTDKIIQYAKISFLEEINYAPFNLDFKDIYFAANPLSESNEVFLKASDLEGKLHQFCISNNQNFNLAELGFGSGLNFVLSVLSWLDNKSCKTNKTFNYFAVEAYPIKLDDLLKIHKFFQTIWDEFDYRFNFSKANFFAVFDDLIKNYPENIYGLHQIKLEQYNVVLYLYFSDVKYFVKSLDFTSKNNSIDIWYLDGFSPSKNAAMWEEKIFVRIAYLSKLQAKVVTFSAAKVVKDGLINNNFTTQKLQGFGAKRHRLVATYLGNQGSSLRKYKHSHPWFARPYHNLETGATIAVVGGGISGLNLVFELIKKGFKVKLIEKNSLKKNYVQADYAGSHITAALLKPLLTKKWDLRSQFYYLGYQKALNLIENSPKILKKLDGIIGKNSNTAPNFTASFFSQDTEYEIKNLIQNNADLYSVKNLNKELIFYPNAGWVDLSSFVQNLLDQSHAFASVNLDVFADTSVTKIIQGNNNTWQLGLDSENKTLITADAIVLATGVNEILNGKIEFDSKLEKSLNFFIFKYMQFLKGHLSLLDSDSLNLNYSLFLDKCYMLQKQKKIIFGSSFDKDDKSLKIDRTVLGKNADFYTKFIPNFKDVKCKITGQVGFRVFVRDHMPMIGAIPDYDIFNEFYFSKNSSHMPDAFVEAQYLPNFFISNAQGSRGLISSTIAAEIISAEILGNPLPLPSNLYYAVHPARLAITDWKRKKI